MVLLAVDDDVVQLTTIKRSCDALEYPKISFIGASNVTHALGAVSDEVVDLVITDLHLGNDSGFDVLRGTKEANPEIPVIVMTAYENAREAVSLLKAGADDYLVKPLRRDDFERAVLRVNEKNTLIRESLLHAAEGPVSSPAAAGIFYKTISWPTC